MQNEPRIRISPHIKITKKKKNPKTNFYNVIFSFYNCGEFMVNLCVKKI